MLFILGSIHFSYNNFLGGPFRNHYQGYVWIDDLEGGGRVTLIWSKPSGERCPDLAKTQRGGHFIKIRRKHQVYTVKPLEIHWKMSRCGFTTNYFVHAGSGADDKCAVISDLPGGGGGVYITILQIIWANI